jgi:hypothetical protein
MHKIAHALPVWFALATVATNAACLAHAGHADDVADDARAPAARSSVTIETRDGYRHITSNGLPDHAPGQFPNRHNPNAIAAQRYAFRVPLEPKPADAPRELARGTVFGVALNGVVFDPGTAEFWRDDPSLGWRMEAIGGPRDLGLDRHHAHVQPQGAYHYHAIPTGLVERVSGKNPRQPVLIGWAADGFPIYSPLSYSDANDPKSKLKVLRSSYRLKTGERPPPPDAPGGRHDGAYTRDWEYVAGSGDLDECNGRVGVTPEFPNGTYYYVITDAFPFVPRLFRGEPDPSFTLRRPPPRGRPGAGPGGGPGRGDEPRRPR